MSPPISSREQAIQMLHDKNESIKTLFDKIVRDTEELSTPEILAQVRRLTELENAMKPFLAVLNVG